MKAARRIGSALLLGVALAGCTRVIDPPPPDTSPPVAPITAGQAGDLLSENIEGGDGNLFSTVEPAECSGLAREVDPPFISDLDPAATDGGHWRVHDRNPVYIEEMVGVYRANFDPRDALSQAAGTIESCRDTTFTVTAMSGSSHDFTLLPAVASGSPDILLWSFRAPAWACDNAFVSAHNAAIEITACSRFGGYDVLSLAEDALDRIEVLANTVV